MKELSRRDVLKGALGFGATLLVPDVVYGHETPKGTIEPIEWMTPPLAIGKAAQLTRKLAEDIADLTPRTPNLETLTEVRQFAQEFVPYLETAGHVKGENLFYPRFRTEDFGDEAQAQGDFYLMAYAECGKGDAYYGIEAGDGSIALNERFFHPDSAMQREDRNHELVATVGHEIAHSNQVSCAPTIPMLGDHKMVEGTTNIVAMDTLFAMSLDGNPIALPAGLSILKEMAQSYVMVRRAEEGRLDLYEDLLDNLPNHGLERGRWEFFKAQGDKTLQGIVNAADTYAARPFAVVVDAMGQGNSQTRDKMPVDAGVLYLPQTKAALSMMSHLVYEH